MVLAQKHIHTQGSGTEDPDVTSNNYNYLSFTKYQIHIQNHKQMVMKKWDFNVQKMKQYFISHHT